MVYLNITIKRIWWVPFYFAAMRVFIFCWAAFADEDDMAAWIEREVQWVFQQGYRLIVVQS